jgi:dihydrofolate reductase
MVSARAIKETPMSATVLYMSMSLDGFVAGPDEAPGSLHDWLAMDADSDHRGAAARLVGVNRQVMDELMSTGAVVAGRGTIEPAGWWAGDHHDGVPIFVLTRHASALPKWPLITYVDDVTTAMTRAKEAAGDRNVLVHGAGTAQAAIAARILDELELHVIPVLFGQGRRLFEGLGPEHLDLERTRVLEGEHGVTHMHYRVRH